MQPTTEAVVIFLPDSLASVILLCVLAALRVQMDDETIAITSIAAVMYIPLYISIKTAEIYLRFSHSNLAFPYPEIINTKQ